VCVAVALVLAAGCNGGSPESDPSTTPSANTERVPAGATVTECEVGRLPDYYVPGDGRPSVIGCAELAASGKPVEFSVNSELIGGEDHVCINPAYRGRRPASLGLYIPAVCPSDPVSPSMEVVDARVPRQGTPGYQLVIWGTVGLGAQHVSATFVEGRAESAVFDIDSELADAVHLRRPLSVFVTELPRRAGCDDVLLEAAVPRGAEVKRLKPGDLNIGGRRLAPQHTLCSP
jgi:hypothetical protein